MLRQTAQFLVPLEVPVCGGENLQSLDAVPLRPDHGLQGQHTRLVLPLLAVTAPQHALHQPGVEVGPGQGVQVGDAGLGLVAPQTACGLHKYPIEG